MNIESISKISRGLPSVTEGIKWGNDLCFMIATKMFCVVVLEGLPKVSIKVTEEQFEQLAALDGVIPAPYTAKNKWILIENLNVFNKKEWEFYISQSYSIVRGKLPKKTQAQLKPLATSSS